MPRRKPAADPRLAVCYVRTSTSEQELSPEAQRAAVAAWAQRQGVEVVATFADTVSGGADLEACPGLLEALAAVQAHGAGRLVVARRDRLARSVLKSALVESLLRRQGARVDSADGAAAGDGPEGELMAGLLHLFAAYERSVIRSRTRAALQAKKVRGERVGAVPIGYSSDAGRLVPDEREQAAIAYARRLRSRKVSLRKIGERLVAAGHLPRGGGFWRPSTVAKMVA